MSNNQNDEIIIEDLVNLDALVKEMKEKIDARSANTYNLSFVFAKFI